MSEIERLGRTAFWHGEVGHAKATIDSGREYLALAQHMYVMELGEVVADRSRLSSRGRAASKGKGKEAISYMEHMWTCSCVPVFGSRTFL